MAKYIPQILVGALGFAAGALLVDQLKKQGVLS